VKVNIPDAQHAHLNAIMDEVFRLEDECGEDLTWAHDEAPESNVFLASDLEESFVDMDEAMETVMEVGARDLDTKIRYWTRILENVRDADNA